jgi:hypothetical protein
MAKSSTSGYRREGDDTLIEIRLREVRQLFHTLDPAPFHEKDLDDAAEHYLLEACREAGTRRPLRLVVHLPLLEAQSEAARTLPDAVHNYFAYRERQLRTDMLRLIHNGGISFLIGLVFLIGCLLLRRWLLALPLGIDRPILGEGLLSSVGSRCGVRPKPCSTTGGPWPHGACCCTDSP